MNDDDIISLLKGKGKEADAIVSKSNMDNSPQQSASSPPIIVRKIFTVTEIKIYPGGQIFHKSTSGWIGQDGYMHKNKEKKKVKEIPMGKVKSLEQY
jgi:tetrahydromethanopterin S-methyltransferase subunit H